MEQKRFDKKNLIVIAALIALIVLVAVVAGQLKPKIDPTLGTLAADATAVPAATDAPAADAAADTTREPAKAFLVVQVAGQMYEPIPLYEEGRYTVTRGDYVYTI